MAEEDQEKTEQASSRRREKAREEGNFAMSKELGSFLVILASAGVLYFSGVWIFLGLAEFMKKSFFVFKGDMTVKDVSSIMQHIFYRFILILLPVFAIPVFGALSYLIQQGFSTPGKPISLNFSKINPVSGIKNILSLSSVVELVKSVLKISILSYVVYVSVAKEWTRLPSLIDMDAMASTVFIGKVTFTIMLKTVWVLAVIAALDYAFQRWKFEKSIRMTKEELKDEYREMEGDPKIKARIKSIQKEMARKRMMQDVPKADVVVTNPTHLAVALKYDRKKANAPIVLAKGAGLVAEKIREIAKKHRVPVIENKPLARSLFKHVNIGREIPVTLYKAVAEILAYVYKLKRKQ